MDNIIVFLQRTGLTQSLAMQFLEGSVNQQNNRICHSWLQCFLGGMLVTSDISGSHNSYLTRNFPAIDKTLKNQIHGCLNQENVLFGYNFFYDNRHKYVTLFKVLWLIHGILQGCRINPLLFKQLISHFTIRQNRKRKDRFIQIYSTFRYPFLTAVAYSNGYINTCEIGLHAECTHVGPSCQ